jgi:hypothetical protein
LADIRITRILPLPGIGTPNCHEVRRDHRRCPADLSF